MPDDKIKISWDDLNSPQVDSLVKQQVAREQSQQHYQHTVRTAGTASRVESMTPKIWYNAVFYMSVFGFLGGFVAWILGECVVFFEGSNDEKMVVILEMLWVTLAAMPISFFLSIAEGAMSWNSLAVLRNGSVGLLFGLIGGILVGLFINKLYVALGGHSADSLLVQLLARSLGWGVFGLFLAIAPAVLLRNWKRLLIGLAGGFLGGLIGGILFDPVAYVTQTAVISRGVGLIAIGAASGAATGLIEGVAKSGWLQVVAGLIAGKQFIVYKNMTYVGSSPQCDIYLFKDVKVAPRHAAVHRLPQGYEIEDLHSAEGTFVNGRPIVRARLRNNDRIQIGRTTFQFQEKDRPLATT